MWSKKSPENQSKNSIRNVQSTQSLSVRQTTTTTTEEYRTRCISYSGTGGLIPNTSPTGSSASNFDNTNYLMPSGSSMSKSTLSLPGNQINVDAKPLGLPSNNINLNYQSVYPNRTTPAFSSFRAPKPSPSYLNAYVSTPRKSSVVNSSTSLAPETNARIIVKKTGKLYDGNPTIPTYETHGKKRGEMLIINNIMFEDKSYRQGAQVDDKKLKDVFEQMGFSVTVKQDLKRNDMQSKVKDFSKKSALKSADIAILVVMSHGTNNTTLGGTEVVGVDDKTISIEELVQYFNEAHCKSMIGKPKIFVFQCCRGDNEQFVQSDAVKSMPVLADSLIAYSTLPGFLSHRDPKLGTWYISALCEVFSQHAHEYSVEDLLKMVDVKVATRNQHVRQTTHYESRGFKRCYLHPK